MTAIPLTSHALKGVKRTLVEVMPELGSAHLSEAIAAGLGYRTHAALLPQLDRRADSDPDYAYWCEEEFADRARALTGAPVDVTGVVFADFEPFGAINTYSAGADRVPLTNSLRKRAWRNAMVAAINAGIEQRLFSIRPGDCRWPGWSADRGLCKGTLFKFSIGGIPALGWVDDIGFDELSIHVALWPTVHGEEFVQAGNAGLHAGETFATGWLERRKGAWLQVGDGVGGGWTFSSRQQRLKTVAGLELRPHGYAAQGSFMM